MGACRLSRAGAGRNPGTWRAVACRFDRGLLPFRAMLHVVRKHARSKVIWVVVAMIIGVFVFWGVDAVVSGVGARTTVAWVDGSPVESMEVARAEYNLLQSYRKMMGDALTPDFEKQLNVRQRALDGLIDRQLLLARARQMGLEIGDKELADTIVTTPGFEADGRFNADVYRRALRGARMTPVEFEEARRADLIVGRLQAVVEDGLFVRPDMARAELLAREEKRRLDFVKVVFSDFTESIKIDPEALVTWYAGHGKDFEEPEKAEIEFIAFGPEVFLEGVEIEEAAVADVYEKGRETKFFQPAARRARHILVRVPEDAKDEDRKAAREKIDDFAKRITGGEDFAVVATAGSEDPGSAPKGGDLGFFEPGRMVKPFEEAASKLEVGEVSEVVETPFGLHLIKLEEVREARTREFVEVREEIVTELRQSRAGEKAQEAAGSAQADIKSGKTIDEVATARQAKVSRPGPLARNAALPELGSSFPFWEKLWAADAGVMVEPAKVGESWVLARLIEKIPAQVPPLADVRERVEGAYRRELAEAKALETAKALLAAAISPGSLAAAAKAADLELETTEPFDAEGEYVPEIGGIPDLKSITFGLSMEKPLPAKTFVFGGDAFVVALGAIELPEDDEAFAKKIETTRTEMQKAMRGEVFDDYVEELKLAAKIEIDRPILDAIAQPQ